MSLLTNTSEILYRFGELKTEEAQKRAVDQCQQSIGDDDTEDRYSFEYSGREHLKTLGIVSESGIDGTTIRYDLSSCQGSGSSFLSEGLDADLLFEQVDVGDIGLGLLKKLMRDAALYPDLEIMPRFWVDEDHYCRYYHEGSVTAKAEFDIGWHEQETGEFVCKSLGLDPTMAATQDLIDSGYIDSQNVYGFPALERLVSQVQSEFSEIVKTACRSLNRVLQDEYDGYYDDVYTVTVLLEEPWCRDLGEGYYFREDGTFVGYLMGEEGDKRPFPSPGECHLRSDEWEIQRIPDFYKKALAKSKAEAEAQKTQVA